MLRPADTGRGAKNKSPAGEIFVGAVGREASKKKELGSLKRAAKDRKLAPLGARVVHEYKVYVETTERMLGCKLVGDTLLDKYKSYVEMRLDGLKLLKEFARHYDESFTV